MKKIKSIIAMTTVTALLTGVMAGCGTSKTATTTPTKEAKKIEITFWDQDDAGTEKILDGVLKDFQDKNPNITVKRTHYETEDLRKNYTNSAMAGKGPDIVLGPNDNLGVFVTGDLLQPADDVMGADFFKTLDPTSLDAAKYQGKQYMIPDRNGNELLLMYNKKYVQEAPKTFEDLEKIGLQLQKDGKVQYGLTMDLVEPFFTIPFLAAFGGKVFDDVNAAKPTVTLNTPAMKDWSTFLKRIHDEGLVQKEGNGDVAKQLFVDGKAAFVINGPWAFGDYKKVNIDFGIAPIPSIGGKDCAPYSAVKGYTISKSVKDADRKAAVKSLLTFLNSKDSQVKMVAGHQQLPTNLEAINDSSVTGNPLIAAQKEPLQKATPMPIIPQMRAIWDAIKPVQQEILGNKTKPEDAPAKMQKKAEDGVKALGL